MRIFMLGWEFPPFITGGLGTACHGLTRALVDQGHEVLFVLPKSVREERSHVRLLGPDVLVEQVHTGVPLTLRARRQPHASHPTDPIRIEQGGGPVVPVSLGEGRVEYFELPAGFSSPYPGTIDGSAIAELLASPASKTLQGLAAASADTLAEALERAPTLEQTLEDVGRLARDNQTGYGWDLFGDAERYAKLACGLAARHDFDVIHAHDWLTYPAGLAVRGLTGKPMVAHVHATEFDRSGEHINPQVYDIERAGLLGADRVICVSELTRRIVVARHGVPESKVDVVYNGVEQGEFQPDPMSRIERTDRIVLFLGRITMQKGPEYFIRAAARVLQKLPNVKFVVAGSGDMARGMIEEAASLGIGHKVLFTGFLRGRDVARVYRMADCYVMPSVSEPFGIAALEAMRHDTPVIISKQSGVSEVLTHALKVDFWDIDEIANKIVAVLKYPPLSQTLREHSSFEVRGLTWDGAAEKVIRSYGAAIASR